MYRIVVRTNIAGDNAVVEEDGRENLPKDLRFGPAGYIGLQAEDLAKLIGRDVTYTVEFPCD